MLYENMALKIYSRYLPANLFLLKMAPPFQLLKSSRSLGICHLLLLPASHPHIVWTPSPKYFWNIATDTMPIQNIIDSHLGYSTKSISRLALLLAILQIAAKKIFLK